jgi:GNAT superfamily N-acetyltransferase
VLSLVNVAHPKFRRELLRAAKAQKYIYEDQIEMAWEQMQYPEDLERHEVLRDGTEIFFRPVKPVDEAALTAMLYSLGEESVQKRYFAHTKTFPHRDVQKLANIDYRQDLAIVGLVPGVSGEEVVAIAQYFLEPKTQSAEVAFIVQDEWQQKGMGTFLLEYLTDIARRRGVKSFTASVLPHNKPMLSIFTNTGYDVKTEFDGEAYQVSYSIADEER